MAPPPTVQFAADWTKRRPVIGVGSAERDAQGGREMRNVKMRNMKCHARILETDLLICSRTLEQRNKNIRHKCMVEIFDQSKANSIQC